jgi:hypothetical protein
VLPRSTRVLARTAPGRRAEAESDQTVSREQGERKPHANRRHLNLPNHPATRPGAAISSTEKEPNESASFLLTGGWLMCSNADKGSSCLLIDKHLKSAEVP